MALDFLSFIKVEKKNPQKTSLKNSCEIVCTNATSLASFLDQFVSPLQTTLHRAREFSQSLLRGDNDGLLDCEMLRLFSDSEKLKQSSFLVNSLTDKSRKKLIGFVEDKLVFTISENIMLDSNSKWLHQMYWREFGQIKHTCWKICQKCRIYEKLESER